MASQLERKASLAFIDENYELAVELFSQAIAIRPNDAELFASRAQANIMLRDHLEALGDANKAIQLDPSMAKAYLRKGVACFKLEEYQTAKVALEKGLPLAQNDPRFAQLIKDCNNCIIVENLETAGLHISTASMKPKYRHEYYQKPEEVVVTIYAKGIPENNVVVDFAIQTLIVAIKVPGETPYHLHLQLFGKIIPDTSRYTVMSTKVEICLAKAEALNWPSLEISGKGTDSKKLQMPSDQRPTDPSTKAKVIDWDKLQAQIEQEEKEEEMKDAATTDIVKIYQKADAETQRAMTKSMVESYMTSNKLDSKSRDDAGGSSKGTHS